MASPHYVKFLEMPALQIGDFRNIWVLFDKCNNKYEHVVSVCPAAYYSIKNIHCLKAFLAQEILDCMIHVFITSRTE